MEELRKELITIANAAPHGAHGKVAAKCEISQVYLQQIRGGRNMTTDNEKNVAFMKKLIKAYKKEIEREAKKLNKLWK